MNKHSMSQLARVVIWLPVVAYALTVTRTFFHTADGAVHLSTDDALANIAYALATEGRYGFLSSPVLFDMPRDHGLFSYGPFYFYLAAGLTWVFGYSLTVVRAIHLGVMLAIALAAGKWFGRAAGGAAGALTAVGVLVAFERGQWPMVRPDSMVSFFAVAMVICAGVAMRSGRARYWAGAGFAAACAALTHLVAWSLIPAAALVFVFSEALSAREAGQRRRPSAGFGARLAALVAGGLGGAALFYWSFGFRIGDQLRFLRGYQDLTGSMSAMSEPGGAYWQVLLQHFKLAYWYLPYPLEYAVWATLAAGAGLVVFLVVRGPAWGRQLPAWIGPPIILWITYLLSLGVYNNFHAGYAILNQVLWPWCVGAMIAGALHGFEPWPRAHRALAVAAGLAALFLGAGVLTLLEQRTEYRALAAGSSVSIHEYTSRVLEPIPAGARAWGTVAFGIEHPGRVQLVQFDDAATLVGRLDAAARSGLAPDYLVLGFTEARSSILSALTGSDPLPLTVARFFPDVRYALVAMTAGPPYGVTRVYARRDDALAAQPTLSAYDARHGRWTRALGSPSSLVMSAVPAARLHLGSDAAAGEYVAIQTLGGEMPAGTYLLELQLTADAPQDLRGIFAATSSLETRDTFGDYGPAFDAGFRFPGERSVLLVYAHPGGPFYVSQFGSGPATIGSVLASPLLPLPDFAARRRPEPVEQPMRATEWVLPEPVPQVGPHPVAIRLTPDADGRTVRVDGNAVQYGYQAYGPKIPIEPFDYVRIRLDVTVHTGTVCVGVLDGTGKRWLVLPDRFQPVYEFQANDSRTVKPVLANCSGVPDNIVPITATIRDGGRATWSERGELYVDQLMRAFEQARPR